MDHFTLEYIKIKVIPKKYNKVVCNKNNSCTNSKFLELLEEVRFTDNKVLNGYA